MTTPDEHRTSNQNLIDTLHTRLNEQLQTQPQPPHQSPTDTELDDGEQLNEQAKSSRHEGY